MLAEAAGLDVAPAEAEVLPAFQAVLAFKAGDLIEARSLVWQALEKAAHPAAGLLAMAIQGRRWALPEHVVAQFENQWHTELRAGFNSSAAGAMARLLAGLRERDGASPDLTDYVHRSISYIALGQKSKKWNRQDLLAACQLLEWWVACMARRYLRVFQRDDSEEKTAEMEEFWQLIRLAKTLCARGMRLFPDEPMFPALLGDQLLGDGPLLCDRPYARYVFQRLKALTQDGSTPELRDLHRRAVEALDLLGPGRVSSKPAKSQIRNVELLEMLYGAVERILKRSRKSNGRQEDDEDSEDAAADGPPPGRRPKRQ